MLFRVFCCGKEVTFNLDVFKKRNKKIDTHHIHKYNKHKQKIKELMEIPRCLDTYVNDYQISVLILGAGASIKTYRSKILERIKDQNLYVITVNFVLQDMTSNASFISNEKRLASVYTNIDEKRLNLITSNLQDEFKIKALVFDYSSLLGEGDCADNAGAMLIRILKKCDVRKIYLAGFDGFDVDTSMNYFVTDFKTAMDYDAVRKKNDDISKQLKLALNEVKYELLTPSKYEI